MKVGEFNQLGKRMTLRIDRSEHRGTQLHGIFVQVDDRSGTTVAATAEQGRFLSTDDPDVILFRLEKGRMIQDLPEVRHAADAVVQPLRSSHKPAARRQLPSAGDMKA